MNNENLIWVDLEMTGLDTGNDSIIEIATLVTDKDLNILAQGPVLAVHQPDMVLDKMDEWNRRQHGISGLIERVKHSTFSMEAAETATIAFLAEYVQPGKSPMCGNSICQDRRFMARQMPRLEAYFHYRNLDVSTIKELTHRWKPELLEELKKESRHLALDDIKDSIAELKFYREKVFTI